MPVTRRRNSATGRQENDAPPAPRTVSPTRRARQQEAEIKELSTTMNLLLVFLSHGWINTLLLTPLNPIRCAYFDTEVQAQGCSATSEEGTMMNWLAVSMFHVHTLLSGLAYTAAGNPILEQRLLIFVVIIVVSALSSGIFFLEEIARPMASLQVVVWLGFLFTALFASATEYCDTNGALQLRRSSAAWAQMLRSASFDPRSKIPVSTIALGIQSLFAIIRVANRTFGYDGLLLSLYATRYSNPTVQCIAQVALMNELWVTLLLTACVLLATPAQQKILLAGQAASLLVCVVLLLSDIEEIRRGEITGTFSAFVLAAVGAFL